MVRLLVIFRIELWRGGSQRPKKAVRVVIDACREKERGSGRGASRGPGFVAAAIVELNAPEAVDRDRRAVGVQQVAEKLAAHDIEGGDGSSKSIADQQIMTEKPEILWGECDSPRGP
jgi:hypothetical protein